MSESPGHRPAAAAPACDWSAAWSAPHPSTGARSLSPGRDGRITLTAPPEAAFLELELYLAGAPLTGVHITVRPHGAGAAADPPYLDLHRLLAGYRWYRLAPALGAAPPPGERVDVCIDFEPPARSAPWAQPYARVYGRLPRRLRARHVALTGPATRQEDVVIIVLNWRRPAETIRCLESLGRADLRGARTLVVDNGSGDGSVERIRERFPAQRILALPQNTGYAGGNNAGIAAALADGAGAVLLLNNDTEVAPDFLEPLLWTLNADRRIAAVSSAILRMDHRDLLDVAYLSLYWGHGIVRHHGVNKLPGEGFTESCEVDVAVGCSVLLSAAALREIGPLEEAYFAYHEEVDWCTRARQHGFRILFQPLSRVWHGGSKSTDDLASPLAATRAIATGPQLPMPIELSWNPVRTYLGARNTVRFVRRNGTLFHRAFFWLHSAYAVPLEALAAVMRQEPALKIGAWSYRRALQLYARGPVPPTPGPPPIGLRELLALPRVLCWSLPRDVRIAYREGRLAQIVELLRGLRDGALNRPLPLARLGLR